MRSPFGPAFGLADADDLSKILRAVADPQRLRILRLLVQHGPMTTGQVVDALRTLKQPSVTHHLLILDKAGLTRPEPDGARVYRRVNRALLTTVAALITPQDKP
jgi:ArsR family transcriptional regulator